MYFQPDKKKDIEECLMDTLQRIRQAESGVRIILGGDFNENLMHPNNRLGLRIIRA